MQSDRCLSLALDSIQKLVFTERGEYASVCEVKRGKEKDDNITVKVLVPNLNLFNDTSPFGKVCRRTFLFFTFQLVIILKSP